MRGGFAKHAEKSSETQREAETPSAPLPSRVRQLAASRERALCLFKSIGPLLTLYYVQVISYAFIICVH